MGTGDADGGGVSSHKRFTGSCGGGAENGVTPFVRIDGGIRLWGREAGISLPANFP
jgi:hypothetical protein